MSRKPRLYLEVLQNGATIATGHYPLHRFLAIRIGHAWWHTLHVPLLPPSQQLKIGSLKQHHLRSALDDTWTQAHLAISPAYSSTGVQEAACFQKGALTILAKIAIPSSPPQVPKNWHYVAGFLSLLVPTRHEVRSLFLAILGAAICLAICVAGIQTLPSRPLTQLEQLDTAYTMRFVNRELLETAPEALQENLDRSAYFPAIIQYYRERTTLLTDPEARSFPFLYPTTVALEQADQAAQQERLQQVLEKQREQAADATSQPSLFFPTVYGEDVTQKMVYLHDHIHTLQVGFGLLLRERRKVSAAFHKDPEYSWNEYRHSSQNAFSSKLSRIRVFHTLTNEESMYAEAKHLGRIAEKTQELQRDASSKGATNTRSTKKLERVYAKLEPFLWLEQKGLK